MNCEDRTLVITAAGRGTRFLPFSRTLPKEILPIGGVPAIEWVVREALSAYASHIIVVVRPHDEVIRKHLTTLDLGAVSLTFVEEDEHIRYGNAAPILSCASLLRTSSAFGVAFGDDVLLDADDDTGDLAAMFAALEERDEAVIAGKVVPREEIPHFGILTPVEGNPQLLQSLRQRPDPREVGEPLAVVSRIILRPSIFDLLSDDENSDKGELDLGLAVGRLAHTHRVRVHRITGQWVTVGDPEHYLEAQQIWQRGVRQKSGSR